MRFTKPEEAVLRFLDGEVVESLNPLPQKYESLPVASLCQVNIERLHNLRHNTGMILEHIDPIPVPKGLENWLKVSDRAYGTELARELRPPRSKLNLLLLCAHHIASTSLENPQRKLIVRNEKEWTYSPVLWEGKQWTLTGRPDYGIWYGEEEEVALKLLVVEVKNGESELRASSRTLAYMAWVHRYRKDLCLKDCTVYGISTNTENFRIMMIDNDSRWFIKFIRVTDNDYSRVLGIIEHLMTESASIPPFSSDDMACLRENKELMGPNWVFNFDSASEYESDGMDQMDIEMDQMDIERLIRSTYY